jgi:hypothetical protein
MNAGQLTRPHLELLLTPAEAAALLGVTELETARVAGRAPAHIELGPRRVRYFHAAVLQEVSTR